LASGNTADVFNHIKDLQFESPTVWTPRSPVTAEAQGRLQLALLFHMTDSPGVKQMQRFLLASDTVHQKMRLTATEQLKQDQPHDQRLYATTDTD
jgi:Mn-containing catalase